MSESLIPAAEFESATNAVNNILGQKNIYGYRFSDDGLRSQPVLPSANTFVLSEVPVLPEIETVDESIERPVVNPPAP